ncbi:EamA family transporter [Ralstonia solanacearum]|uniref:EamA family transporter n=1 Tax=Ralstonia solanacearum TaxID=305 RepID=UPI00044A0BC3|nr:EamA family transporter [Ralstonia solanacearum]EUJ16351.1 membrane protein [Ralstonia solanacearum P673]MCL9845831.1 EamA family transporter [Ralstonia solanacearum]MCL9849755.1 EamA family transporter [Ralstonia solanacearum]MCL9856368.1 EamA family transporter [Ralstonia solanacearum]MCL9861095.1 EamA family transporter [Ralstonia solanacearum]
MSPKDLLLALTVVLVWGVNFVVIKVGLHGVPPMLLGALRFLLVAFPAVLFVPRPKTALKWLLAYGATISLGQFAFLFSAMYVGMPAGLASLVLQSQAFFTLTIAAVVLREPIRWFHLAGMAVAACGLAMIGMAGTSSAGAATGMTTAGFLLTLCAAFSWSSGNIVTKRIGPVNVVSLVVWAALIPPVPFFLLSYWMEGPQQIAHSLANLGGSSIGAIVYLAFGATLFGYSLWSRLLARYAASQVAPLTLLVPVVGLVSAALLLGERLAPAQWLGGAVVMAGLLLNVFGGRWATRRALA